MSVFFAALQELIVYLYYSTANFHRFASELVSFFFSLCFGTVIFNSVFLVPCRPRWASVLFFPSLFFLRVVCERVRRISVTSPLAPHPVTVHKLFTVNFFSLLLVFPDITIKWKFVVTTVSRDLISNCYKSMNFNAFSICIIFEIFLEFKSNCISLNDILNSKSVSETNHVIF